LHALLKVPLVSGGIAFYSHTGKAGGLLNGRKIAVALDGLPEEKMHCSNMAASALHAAVQQYRSTVAGETPPVNL